MAGEAVDATRRAQIPEGDDAVCSRGGKDVVVSGREGEMYRWLRKSNAMNAAVVARLYVARYASSDRIENENLSAVFQRNDFDA